MSINTFYKLLTNHSFLIIVSAVIVFGLCIWFVSNPSRAASLDRYILYHVDDLFRYNYIKMALYNPWVFLNPYVKPGSVFINTLFLYILPLGISSLRILNSIFSLAILFLIYKLTKKIGFSQIGSTLALWLTLTFPVYFIASISTLAEIMFCFFLIWAVYLLYCHKFFLSALIVSFLPTIRQEGIVFLLVWILLLPGRRKMYSGWFLALPFLTWSALNYILLGHPFIYTFFCNLPDKAPPNCTASFPQLLHIIITLLLHPIFIGCFIGLILSYKNKQYRYRYLFVCFISYLITIFIANILHFIDAKAFSREIRFLVPLVPIMAIYATHAIEHLCSGNKLRERFILLLIIFTLPLVSIYQIRQLQRDPTVVADSITGEGELIIKKTGYWLDEYAKKEGIVDIYIPGDIVTDKVIRRLWIYLFGNVKYYVIIGNMESYKVEDYQPLDWVTYTIVPLKKDGKGIFVTKKPIEQIQNKLSHTNYVLLKDETRLPLYIYLMQKSSNQ